MPMWLNGRNRAFVKLQVGGSIPSSAFSMARFREVLKTANFFLLWMGQVISQMGDHFGPDITQAITSVLRNTLQLAY